MINFLLNSKIEIVNYDKIENLPDIHSELESWLELIEKGELISRKIDYLKEWLPNILPYDTEIDDDEFLNEDHIQDQIDKFNENGLGFDELGNEIQAVQKFSDGLENSELVMPKHHEEL